MRDLQRRPEAEAKARKVSPLRVLDGVFGGRTFSESIDAERSRSAGLTYADQMQAAFADGVTADELNELRMGMVPLAAQGADVSAQAKVLDAIEQQIQMREFLQTVPEADRASAALDPAAFASSQREAAQPQYFSVGGNLVAADRRSATAAPVWTAPVTPEPPTTDRVLAAALDKLSRGLALTPGEDKIVNRYINGDPPSAAEREPTPTRILGAIQEKIARGVPLNEGEQQIYEDSKLSRIDPLTAMVLGGGVPGVAAPAPGAHSPPARNASGQVSQKGGVYYPQSAADMAAIPKGARFVNPADGALLTKAR